MTDKAKGVSAELLAFRAKDGTINARDAVQWARKHRQSALYAELDWDDTHAAEEFRVWQVRRLIAIHIVTETGERSTVSLSIDRKNGGGYRMIDDVIAAPDWRKAMLADALADLSRVQQKYERLSELARVWEEVRRVKAVSNDKGRKPPRRQTALAA